jgi:basic membrane protein A
MLKAAQEVPDVDFCHATGTMAHTENLANFHNAFAAIYEGRYLAGIAAGMKLNEIKAAGKLKGEVPMMGYVGAYTNVKDKKDYQFRMVYFKVQNTIVEFRLETTRATYPLMEKEFEAILKSLKF